MSNADAPTDRRAIFTQPDEQPLDLKGLVDIFARRWRLFVAVSVGSLLLAIIVSLILKPTYEAVANIRIDPTQKSAIDLEAAAPAAAVPAPPPLRCSSSASAASKGDAAAAAAIVAVAPPPKRDLAEGTCLSAKVRGEGGGRERESDEGEARSEREGVPAAGLVGVVVVIIPEVPVAPAPPPPKSGPNRRPAAPVPPVIAPESTELGKMGAGLLGGVVVKSTSIFLFFFLSMPPLSPSLKRRSLATRRCLDFQKLNPRRCLRDVK